MVSRGAEPEPVKKNRCEAERNRRAAVGIASAKPPLSGEGPARKPRQYPPRCWRGFCSTGANGQQRTTAASGAEDRGGRIADIRFACPDPPARSRIRRSTLRRDRPQFRCRRAAPAADADERRRAGAGHRRVPQGTALLRVRRDPRPAARSLLPPLGGLLARRISFARAGNKRRACKLRLSSRK